MKASAIISAGTLSEVLSREKEKLQAYKADLAYPRRQYCYCGATVINNYVLGRVQSGVHFQHF